jgi:signal transduction histidine kinase
VTEHATLGRRFLVVAPVGRDGELICTLLNTCGYSAECVSTIGEAAHVESTDLLGLILTDEALSGDGVDALRKLAQRQPVWSDLPVMLLTSGPAEPQYAAIASQVRMEIRSLILLDRPVRKEMLLSAVQAACTARMKQFEMRDAAKRQSQSDEALRTTEKLAMAGSLAATMAHEVNNPLEALGNLVFLIENSSALDEAKSFAQLATKELGRISEIVQHTLRFHRAPSTPELTELADLATSAVALFRGKMLERHILETTSARRTYAFCSAGEIRQALVNLIGNAIDAMPDGGHLHVRVSPVKYNGSHFARITVSDTGTGIRDDIRPNLFTQFFTTKGSRGTGLGLWLTRDIVLRNRGKLRFRSRTTPPSGTTFAIFLPATAQLDLVQNHRQHPNQQPTPIRA